MKVGIRSTALLFGEQTRPILAFLSASTISLITLAGYLNGNGLPYYLGTGQEFSLREYFGRPTLITEPAAGKASWDAAGPVFGSGWEPWVIFSSWELALCSTLNQIKQK